MLVRETPQLPSRWTRDRQLQCSSGSSVVLRGRTSSTPVQGNCSANDSESNLFRPLEVERTTELKTRRAHNRRDQSGPPATPPVPPAPAPADAPPTPEVGCRTQLTSGPSMQPSPPGAAAARPRLIAFAGHSPLDALAVARPVAAVVRARLDPDAHDALACERARSRERGCVWVLPAARADLMRPARGRIHTVEEPGARLKLDRALRQLRQRTQLAPHESAGIPKLRLAHRDRCCVRAQARSADRCLRDTPS